MGACGSRLNHVKSEMFSRLNVQDNNVKGVKTTKTPTKTKRENIERIELTETIVQQYVELEMEIYRLESRNVLKKYESKMIFADQLKTIVDQLEATYKELKKQTEKEKADVDNIEQPSVKSFLKQQGIFDQRMEKEKQEYLDALNKQEVSEKELKGALLQYERASKIAEYYKSQTANLNDLYEKQDELLVGIFGLDYASEQENKLEAQLDDALEWQQRVSLAKFKWSNGRVLLVHALTQMAFGITRWKELNEIDSKNLRMRYFAAAEARNNFIAAGQNVQACRVYLVSLCYKKRRCKRWKRLFTAHSTAFNRMKRWTNRWLFIKKTHEKIAALIQWFDKVITGTILKDLDKANTSVAKFQKQLRVERLNLMKKKVKEEFGRELDIKYDIDLTDPDDEELLALNADQVNDQDELPGKDLKEILNLSQPDGRNPTPLPLSKLAPIPSKETLFGDVKQKLNEFDTARSSFQKRNDLLREKSEMALQEKIRLRQQTSRRTRNQRQKSAIVPSLPGTMNDVETTIVSDDEEAKAA
ncbi:hypothetical protein M3Y94_00438100 [Aphelenchoides besseyi]|nr:hypothetical protein M3Y94_00438100 [Aphelenchoides besseyi]